MWLVMQDLAWMLHEPIWDLNKLKLCLQRVVTNRYMCELWNLSKMQKWQCRKAKLPPVAATIPAINLFGHIQTSIWWTSFTFLGAWLDHRDPVTVVCTGLKHWEQLWTAELFKVIQQKMLTSLRHVLPRKTLHKLKLTMKPLWGHGRHRIGPSPKAGPSMIHYHITSHYITFSLCDTIFELQNGTLGKNAMLTQNELGKKA